MNLRAFEQERFGAEPAASRLLIPIYSETGSRRPAPAWTVATPDFPRQVGGCVSCLRCREAPIRRLPGV
jgi:hypothetical protein